MMFSKSKKGKQKFIACTHENKKYEFINPKELYIKQGKETIPIEIVSDKQGFVNIVWKKKKYLVDIIEKNQNQYEILVNGVSYSISVESPFSYKRRKYLAKNKEQSKVERIQAPMPGKIVEFLVEEDQEVKVGDPLLILEAMKMQNEIVSNIQGKVNKINFHAEDNVMKDDVLIEMEK
ncbi:MAG: acetyl-CoA carboxylase biotin carboxyl carrier protein subunit [Marinilabiliales bacterium]|nr:MAG: acetyl-CoA carboxylase biotin carboxyl carrier protein subunit [Marinilabiliales bacterium]